MKNTILLSAFILLTGFIYSQTYEWIEFRYRVSTTPKYPVIVVGNFKPYGLETETGEKVKNIPMAIEVMEEKGYEYVEAYPITAPLKNNSPET